MSAIISHILEDTISEEIGLQKGDIIVSMNGAPIHDVIDYMYNSSDNIVNLTIQRGKEELYFEIEKDEGEPLGFELKSFRTKTCRNKCMFCFVTQLPKGMRKPLYLKDDDYRMSFLYGNYITLTNITNADKKRIQSLRLSPLYISVHTTNNDLRRKMLGNPKSTNILKEILELTAYKIKLHTQIVLCPGLNDGDELSNTIKDLQKFYPYIASIAIVPVGLTNHGNKQLKPVRKEDAIKTIEIVNGFRRRFKRRHGDPIVYLADELYLKAEHSFPQLKTYGDLPQIENGVGLIPAFQHCARNLKFPKSIEPVKVATFTGVSFMPYLEAFSKKLNSIEGVSLDVFKVENRFFGPNVTVAGLLTGKDILKTLIGKSKADCLLVPDVTLREGSEMFLDNVTLKDLGESLGMQIKVIDSTPGGLLKGIQDECKRND